jgi:hypothetical protein
MRASFPFRAILGAAALSVGGYSATIAAPAPQQSPATSTSPDSITTAIAEASQRFGVPQAWIRAVMRVESAGNPAAVSSAGAVGLMQVMPETFADLRAKLGLGGDPFAVRDNILAGAAYLRRMFDRYGSPGFLAAYNAGPGRWEAHLAGGQPLPKETVAYLVRLAPLMGFDAGEASMIGRSIGTVAPRRPSIFVQLGDGRIGPAPPALSGLGPSMERPSEPLRSADIGSVGTPANTDRTPPGMIAGGALFVPRTPTGNQQ